MISHLIKQRLGLIICCLVFLAKEIAVMSFTSTSVKIHSSRVQIMNSASRLNIFQTPYDLDNAQDDECSNDIPFSDVPLVFVHGLKGSHLAFHEEDNFKFGVKSKYRTKTKRRTWLTLAGLLNIPSLDQDHPHRSLALPITYDENGVQHRDHLFVDGMIDHIIQFGKKGESEQNIPSLDLFPFYGHVSEQLNTSDKLYRQKMKGEQIVNEGNMNAYARPTAIFTYDWRRSIPEVAKEFHEFCEETFPDRPVQVLAHSLGGLISYTAMRHCPEKYSPGGVLVGVPFGTGIQYLQDMHKGYYTEINRCQQFTPIDQFTFASHWTFFHTDPDHVKDDYVDVSNHDIAFEFQADKSSIGKSKVDFNPSVKGDPIHIDFHNVEHWEEHELGIFHTKHRPSIETEERLDAFRKHMRIQLAAAKEWRETTLRDLNEKELKEFPPLVLCASDTIPTVNQILRKKSELMHTGLSLGISGDAELGSYVHDYVSGRSVKGDGRIDYDKAFPSNNVPFQKVPLHSPHSKQFCREENGGDFRKIWDEVNNQVETYMATSTLCSQNKVSLLQR